MKIVSDFVDYYDSECSGNGRELLRNRNGGPSKKEAFVLFHTLKFKVPVHGKVSVLYESLLKELEKTDAEFRADANNRLYNVVVYGDLNKHDQSSLKKVTMVDALATPDAYGAQVVPVGTGRATTYEWYKVGYKQFWVEHSSDDDFRSGVGDVKTKLINGTSSQFGLGDLSKIFVSPLVRVAFVPYRLTNGRNNMMAIDLDTAPKLAGTPIEEELSAAECCEDIARFLHLEVQA